LPAGPRFLVHADPDEVLALSRRADSDEARLYAAVYRTSAGLHRSATTAARRDVLMVDAARRGADDLGRRLSAVPDDGGSAAGFRIDWATGGRLDGSRLWTGDAKGGGRGPASVCAMTAGVLDGRAVATAVTIGGVGCTWDVLSGEVVARPDFDQGGVQAVKATVIDGRPRVVVSGYSVVDGLVQHTVWLMDPETGQRTGLPLAGHRGWIKGLAVDVLGDGRTLAISAGDDGTARAWDLAGERSLCASFDRHEGRVIAAATAMLDGRAVAVTGDSGGVVRMWDPLDGRPVREPIATGERLDNLVVVAVGGRPCVATGSVSTPVVLHDLDTGRHLCELLPAFHLAQGNGPMAVTELGGRPVVVAGGWDRCLRLLDPATGDQLCEPMRLSGEITPGEVAVVEAATGPIAVVGGHGSAGVEAWDLAAACDAAHARGPRVLPGRVTALAVGELDGRDVVVTGHHEARHKSTGKSERALVCVTDLGDGALTGPPAAVGEGAVSLGLSRIGGRLVAVTGQGCDQIPSLLPLDGDPALVTAFTLASPRARHHNGAISAVATAELYGRPVAVTGGRSNEARVWYLDDGVMCASVKGHSDVYATTTAVAVGVLRDRPVAVTAAPRLDRRVQVWWVSSGRPVCRPETGHTADVRAVALAELNGTAVAVTAGEDHTARVWDLAAGTPVRAPLTGHTAPVLAVTTMSLGGRLVVVTGGEDRTVRMWDADTSRELRRLHLPDTVTALAPTADGRVVAAFGDDIAVLSPAGTS
jgi:WD40 repeat protein